MLHFFRKIRKALLDDNRLGRYFFYAIGEIILVVIGILIALQVNNWNALRKSRKLEAKVIENLHNEFTKNKDAIIHAREANQEAFNAGKLLMSLILSPEDKLQTINTDSLIFFSLANDPFHPSENVLNELLNAGRLQLVNNKKLKDLLFEWTHEKGKLNETFRDIDQKIEDQLIPYLSKVYPLKDIDKYGILNWETSSKIDINKHYIFADLEFENHMDDLLFHTANHIAVLISMETIVDSILEETKTK